MRKLLRAKEEPAGTTHRGRSIPESTPQQHASMGLNVLTVNFRHLERETLLEDWEWLIGPKLPILLTACGDAFVQDVHDGAVHLLDVGAGTLQQVAGSSEEFQSLLSDRGFVMGFFGVELVAALRAAGSHGCRCLCQQGRSAGAIAGDH